MLRYFAALDLPPVVLKEDTKQKVVRLHEPLGVVDHDTGCPWRRPHH
jgi:hypothetical protein